MIEKSEVAQHISSLMLEVSEQINQSILLVKNECTTEEFDAYLLKLWATYCLKY
jgi:hypothetical protein